KEKGVSLKQETSYPDQGATKLSFTCERATDLKLNVRHPWWATEGFAISVNGQQQSSVGMPGSFVALNRSWKSGDTVQVSMPMSFRMEGFKDNPKRAAVMYGPLVMAAQTDSGNRLSAIVTDDETFLAGMKPVAGKALEFTAPGNVFRTNKETETEVVTFRPLLRMMDDSYAVYWDRMSAQELAAWTPPQEPAGR